jgi:hypothetical protein
MWLIKQVAIGPIVDQWYQINGIERSAVIDTVFGFDATVIENTVSFHDMIMCNNANTVSLWSCFRSRSH